MRWHAYLQLRGAEARAAGMARDSHYLEGRDATLWLQGYDAVDEVLTAKLCEIRAGWLAANRYGSRAVAATNPVQP